MSKIKIISSPVGAMPWQERPDNIVNAPVWRYTENPIIRRNPFRGVNKVFNSAVMYYGRDGIEFIGVFRGEGMNGLPYLYVGKSPDGVNWQFDAKGIDFVDENGRPQRPECPFDPRLLRLDGAYYIIWCQMNHGSAIGMAKTTDFKTFTLLESPFLPYNRNAVLFPRKINGKYMMLSRPSDTTHTRFGDIFISESPDMVYWGRHRHVMSKGPNWWEDLKIGGGPAPIETSEGWLMFYHGVLNSCNGFVYSMGGAVLDIDDPSVVRYRCDNFLLTPEEWYETCGATPNVAFPCATVHDPATGRIAIYYGAADTYVALAFTEVDDVVGYIREYNVIKG